MSNLSDEPLPPAYLYRYISMDGGKAEWAADLLVQNRLYLSSPLEFNDPFDCLPVITVPSEEEVLSGVLDRMRSRVEGLGPSDVADANLAAMKRGGPATIRNFAVSAFNTTADALGVYCFSERADDILMWSHYAACHRGIVVRFDMSKWPFESLSQLWRVRYENSRPIVAFKGPLDQDELFRALILKSDHWAHEREWRLLVQRRSRQVVEIPPDLIDAVIFGTRTSTSIKELVTSWTATREAPLKLFQALPHPSEFGLGIIQLESPRPEARLG